MKSRAAMNFIRPALAARRDYLFARYHVKLAIYLAGAVLLCLLIIQSVVVGYNFVKWHSVDPDRLRSQYDDLLKKMEHVKHAHAIMDESDADDLHLTHTLVELAKVRPAGIKFTMVNADKQAVTIEGFTDKTEKVHLFSNKINALDEQFTDVEAQHINLEGNLITFQLLAGIKREVKE